MFDYHMHSWVSFDSQEDPANIILAAERMGLKEICFTDHTDYFVNVDEQKWVFDQQVYSENYDHLTHPTIKIRRGMEFGIKPDNAHQLAIDAKKREYDFILGSVHFVKEIDVYETRYWADRTVEVLKGYHALLFAVLCYFLSGLCGTRVQIHLFTAVLMGIWSCAAAVLSDWLLLYVAAGYSLRAYALVSAYLPMYFYTLLAVPVCYGIQALIRRYFGRYGA